MYGYNDVDERKAMKKTQHFVHILFFVWISIMIV